MSRTEVVQAILVLYLADPLAHGGLGMSAGTATSVSTAYGTLVHLVSVAGGRLAACGHYATDDDRRDAGFALHYLAINIGAFAGPLITGRLGDRKGRHREAAELALAPEAMRRAVRLIAAAPWVRRTLHPVH